MTEVLTKNQIRKALQEEAISAHYSGKTKTFYVDKMPSGLLLFSVEQSGFNIVSPKPKNK